jgi:hypothetical protein
MDALRQRAQQSMELAREAGENPQFNTGRLIALVTEQDALVRDLLAALEAQQGGRGPDKPEDCPFGNVRDCCGHHAACVAMAGEPPR